MKARYRHLVHGGIATVLAASLWTTLYAADDPDAPIVIGGQQRQYDTFHLEKPSVALELLGVYQHNTTEFGGRKVEDEQFLFEELLELATTGHIVHPNLFDLSLQSTLGASQAILRSDGSTINSYGALYTWDARGTLFRASDRPMTVYSRRDQRWVFPQFGPAQRATTTDTGGILDIRSPTLPTRLSISHLESKQSGLAGLPGLSYTRDAFNWFSSARLAPNQVLDWNYSFAQVEQSDGFREGFQTHDATLTHTAEFGLKGRSRLTSTIDYSQRSGNIDFQHFRWSERLRLHHGDTFRTRYDYRFDYFSVGEVDTTRNRAGAGFTHLLYKSLTTSGDLAFQHTQTSDDSTALEALANLNWDYRKEVPLGVLHGTLGLSYAWQEAEARTTVTQVIDQPALFADAFPIVLVGTNIDPNSIVITDPSGLLLFQPGIDFDVTQFVDRVEISRIIGGRIGPGTAVLLDFQLTPLPAATTTSQSLRSGLRYDIKEGMLKGLGVYGRYNLTSQDISSPDPGAFVPNDFSDIIYGVDYRFWRMTLGAERQIHDADVNPFTANRVFGRYGHRISDQTTLNLNTAYTTIEYRDPENQLELFTVSGQLVHQFDHRLLAIATLLYRNEEDDLRGGLSGFEQQLELRWKHRQTQAFILFRNAQLNNVDQDQSFQFLQIGIRREF